MAQASSALKVLTKGLASIVKTARSCIGTTPACSATSVRTVTSAVISTAPNYEVTATTTTVTTTVAPPPSFPVVYCSVHVRLQTNTDCDKQCVATTGA